MASARQVWAAAVSAAFSLTLAAAMAWAAILCAGVDCGDARAVLDPAGDSVPGEGGEAEASVTGSISAR